jgi:hypothetical protein
MDRGLIGDPAGADNRLLAGDIVMKIVSAFRLVVFHCLTNRRNPVA